MSNIVQHVLPLSWRTWLGSIPLVDRVWYCLTTFGKPPIRVVQSDGITIELPYNAGEDYVKAVRTETYEHESWKRIRAAVSVSTSTFLDVGANIGWYSLQVAQMGRRVIAVEPARDNLKRLVRNLELNPRLAERISIVPVAASDVAGLATLHLAFTGIGGHTLIRTHRSYRSYTVQTVPLDDVVDQFISVAKIDVEGNEPRVLAGMKHIIKRSRPALSLECFEKGLLAGGHSIESLLDILRNYGYTPFTEDGAIATATSIREMYRKGKVPAINLWCVQ